MRSNSKEVRKAMQLHLIDIVSDEEEVKTSEEAIKIIAKDFTSWLNRYELKKNKTIQGAFDYWLSGLALHTYYMTDDIINFLHSIGLYGKNKKQEETKASYLYHYLIFKECYNEIIKRIDKKILIDTYIYSK